MSVIKIIKKSLVYTHLFDHFISVWTLRAVDSSKRRRKRSINRKWMNERRTQFDHIVKSLLTLRKQRVKRSDFLSFFLNIEKKVIHSSIFITDEILCMTQKYVQLFIFLFTYYIKLSTPQLLSICWWFYILVDTKCLSHELPPICFLFLLSN